MKTIVEVGAYRGFETTHFLEDQDAVVYAFEPDHDLYKDLNLLAAKEPRLTVLPMAVGIGDVSVSLFLLPDGNSMTEIPLFSNLNYYGVNMGWAMRLDTFMYLYNIDTIDYLRIDAPFHEEMCLESLGDRLKQVKGGRIRCYSEDFFASGWLRDRDFQTQMDNDPLPNVRFWRT